MALKELVYTSLAGVPGKPGDVEAILASSERNNVATGITGLLLFDGVRYIQILEGTPESVDRLFETITSDTRHGSIELLYKGVVTGRAFENWRMAYEELPPGLLEELAENMAVVAMELVGETLEPEDSFGTRLNGMFIDAIAAE